MVMVILIIMKIIVVIVMDKFLKVIFYILDLLFSLIIILRLNFCIKVIFFFGVGFSVVYFDFFCDIFFILGKLFLG